MSGIGLKKVKQLGLLGITTISDLVSYRGSFEGFSPKIVQSLKEQANSALKTNKPPELFWDFWKEENPYAARYGDAWKCKIKQVSSMSGYVCITDMVEHMITESAKVM